MLTCEDVRDLLPGLATGEHAAPEVREHLATCDACRAERARVAREIEAVRADLAALAPSPFLEDAVVEAAHEVEEPARAPRRWPYVAAALLAAAALFVVVLLPRLREQAPTNTSHGAGGEDDETDSAASVPIWIPPSAGQVAAARAENAKSLRPPPAGAPANAMRYETWPEGAPTDGEVGEAFLPPTPEALQRFVYGDERGRAGPRTYTLTSPAQDAGVFLLGTGLLNEIGGTQRAGGGGEIVLGDKRWEPTPGTKEGEIEVVSPDPGGASARVRVQVDTSYSGTLLLEDPIARALGLNLFEIPGEALFSSYDGHDLPVQGWRARARVRIPELDFDRVVEVQVVPERPWMTKRASEGGERGLRFLGLKPDQVCRAEEVEFDSNGKINLQGGLTTVHNENGIDHVDLEPGTYRFLLGFTVAHTSLAVPDTPVLGPLFQHPWAWLAPTALDFDVDTSRRLVAERWTLNGRWEPGAAVVVARVWRGRTAIPSAEAVVMTEVGEDGRISFPRIAGEKGAMLRMLVTTKDGNATFHEVSVEPSLRARPRLEGHVRANGKLDFEGSRITLLQEPWRGDEVTGPPAPDRYAMLVEALHRRTMDPALRDEDGFAKVELLLRVDADAPWRLVQWTLQAAADPSVKIRHVRLGRIDAPEDRTLAFELPLDRALVQQPVPAGSALPAPPVSLLRSASGEALTIRQDHVSPAPSAPIQPAALEDQLRRLVAAIARSGSGSHLRCAIRVPPPGLVTFAEVFDVASLMRRAGVADVVFQGAPLR